MASPKPRSDIRTFFKRSENQREQVAPEKEGNVNDIKSDLIVIDENFLLLVSYLYKDSTFCIVLS